MCGYFFLCSLASVDSCGVGAFTGGYLSCFESNTIPDSSFHRQVEPTCLFLLPETPSEVTTFQDSALALDVCGEKTPAASLSVSCCITPVLEVIEAFAPESPMVMVVAAVAELLAPTCSDGGV